MCKENTENKMMPMEDWSEQVDYLFRNLGGVYDEDEIYEALGKEKEITDGIRMWAKIGFDVIEKMSDFIEAKLYRRLGFENFKNWITSLGGAPSTFYRYLTMYRTFTERFKIPRSEYEFIDTTKLMTILPLTKYNLPLEEMKEAIIEADELTLPDLKITVKEKLEELHGFKPIKPEPVAEQGEIVMDLWCSGEDVDVTGTYKLVRLSEDEEKQTDLASMTKIARSTIKKTVVYYDDEKLQYLRIVT